MYLSCHDHQGFDYNVNADDAEYEAEVLKNTFESVFNCMSHAENDRAVNLFSRDFWALLSLPGLDLKCLKLAGLF